MYSSGIIRPARAFRAGARPAPLPCRLHMAPCPAAAPRLPPARALSGASSLTRLEHMDTVLLHPWRDLDLAENELLRYCSRLDPDDQPEKCWQAYNFFERKRERAAAACDPAHPKSCAELERLNDMTHQLLCTGSMDDLVATFSSLARVEEVRAAKAAAQEPEPAAGGASAGAQLAGAGGMLEVHEVFVRLDIDGDGKISLLQLHQGMALMGQDIDGDAVCQICEALDLHCTACSGGLDEDQFKDVLDAYRLRSRSEVATMWRHHHPARPSWWSDPHAGKGSMMA